MTADVLSFERAVRQLRGPAAEAERKERIKERWAEARRRAWDSIVYASDVGLFGLDALVKARSPIYAGTALTVFQTDGTRARMTAPADQVGRA